MGGTVDVVRQHPTLGSAGAQVGVASSVLGQCIHSPQPPFQGSVEWMLCGPTLLCAQRQHLPGMCEALSSPAAPEECIPDPAESVRPLGSSLLALSGLMRPQLLRFCRLPPRNLGGCQAVVWGLCIGAGGTGTIYSFVAKRSQGQVCPCSHVAPARKWGPGHELCAQDTAAARCVPSCRSVCPSLAGTDCG